MDRQMSDKNSPANNISILSLTLTGPMRFILSTNMRAIKPAMPVWMPVGKAILPRLMMALHRIGQAGSAMIGHRKSMVI